LKNYSHSIVTVDVPDVATEDSMTSG